jgi:hypothetical protein
MYTIKKGKHSSGFHFGFTFKKNVSFDVCFSNNCLYKPFPLPDTKDINKLCGVSTTLFHHKQSGRIGWRCVDESGKIELVTYSYDSWKRDISDQQVLCKVKPNIWFNVKIEDFETHYQYTVNYLGKSYINNDHKKYDWLPIKYLLYPYFGGNNVVPHEMHIFLIKK